MDSAPLFYESLSNGKKFKVTKSSVDHLRLFTVSPNWIGDRHICTTANKHAKHGAILPDNTILWTAKQHVLWHWHPATLVCRLHGKNVYKN